MKSVLSSKKVVLGALTVAASCLCSAPTFAITERGYEESYRTQVMPFYQQGESLTFKGKDGVPIHAWKMIVPKERGAIVILPGQGEPLLKYAEVAYDLRTLGMSIYMIDHRGQGASGRMTQNPKVQYVENFADYADDLEIFVDQIVNQTPHEKRFLLAHSMGGAIASLYFERHPHAFDAAVLSSPMELLNTNPYSEKAAIAITTGAHLVGMGASYSIGQGPFDPARPASESRMSPCEARHKMTADVFTNNPSQLIDGVSFLWVLRSLEGDIQIRAAADKVTTPILLFQAGADLIVEPDGQDEFCGRAKNCRIAYFPTAYHEILMERDPIRDRAIALISDYFTHQ